VTDQTKPEAALALPLHSRRFMAPPVPGDSIPRSTAATLHHLGHFCYAVDGRTPLLPPEWTEEGETMGSAARSVCGALVAAVTGMAVVVVEQDAMGGAVQVVELTGMQ
jgi:hypothetical protein